MGSQASPLINPVALQGPFAQVLTEPAYREPQRFSGSEGVTGSLLGLASKFLEGVSQGRLRKFQMEENKKGQALTAANAVLQMMRANQDIPRQTLRDIESDYSKAMAGTVSQELNAHKPDVKTPGGAVLNVLKHIVGGLAGPVPKGADVNTDALYSMINRASGALKNPEVSNSRMNAKSFGEMQSIRAQLGKSPDAPLTTDDLEANPEFQRHFNDILERSGPEQAARYHAMATAALPRKFSREWIIAQDDMRQAREDAAARVASPPPTGAPPPVSSSMMMAQPPATEQQPSARPQGSPQQVYPATSTPPVEQPAQAQQQMQPARLAPPVASTIGGVTTIPHQPRASSASGDYVALGERTVLGVARRFMDQRNVVDSARGIPAGALAKEVRATWFDPDGNAVPIVTIPTGRLAGVYDERTQQPIANNLAPERKMRPIVSDREYWDEKEKKAYILLRTTDSSTGDTRLIQTRIPSVPKQQFGSGAITHIQEQIANDSMTSHYMNLAAGLRQVPVQDRKTGTVWRDATPLEKFKFAAEQFDRVIGMEPDPAIRKNMMARRTPILREVSRQYSQAVRTGKGELEQSAMAMDNRAVLWGMAGVQAQSSQDMLNSILGDVGIKGGGRQDDEYEK